MNPVHFDSRSTACDVACTFSRRQVVLGGVAATLVAPLGGCGGAALFAPFFIFTYEGVVGLNAADRKIVTVNFFPQSKDQTSGLFEAGAKIKVLNNDRTPFVDSTFKGTFDGRDLKFNLDTAKTPLATNYLGRFNEDFKIDLTPVESGFDSITIRLADGSFIPQLTSSWQDASGALTLILSTDPLTDDTDKATVLLTGLETRATGPAVKLSGYANVHYIELARPDGTRLVGTLQPSSTPVKPTDPPQTTATITFEGGAVLRRV